MVLYYVSYGLVALCVLFYVTGPNVVTHLRASHSNDMFDYLFCGIFAIVFAAIWPAILPLYGIALIMKWIVNRPR
jgi:hypothetical protein